MAINVAINGFGRIGRVVLKFLMENKKINVVGINDLTEPKVLAHLLKYDSVHGVYNKEVKAGDNFIEIDGKKISVSAEKEIKNIPWKNVDIVLECTGVFKDKEAVSAHIKNGAKKVIYSAPLKGADVTLVLGVNEKDYDPKKHHVISNASCTTNCLAPVAKILNDNFKIINGFMTTIHSYTNDQKILDLPHKDLRRARAAAVSMIPTTTGAAKAVGLVLPELLGKLDGYAMRVPTPNVSVVDLCINVEKETTVEEVNKVMKKASEGELKNILSYVSEPLVSIDFNNSRFSSIFDSLMTSVMGKTVKILSWYDNETGYSKRLEEITQYIGDRL